MYGGALADPQYCPYGGATILAQKETRKLLCSFSSIGANERVVTNSWTLLWLSGSFFFEYPFPGKVESNLREGNPITSIRWTT